MYHGSYQKITEITDGGIFGGIFASACEVSAQSHGNVLHEIDSPRHLTDFEINYEIEGAYDVALELANDDEELADAIMDASCPVSDDCPAEDIADTGWEIQRLRGVLAGRLGYTSVEMHDEHGTTTLCLPGCTIRAI